MSGPQFIHMDTYAMSVSPLRTQRDAGRAAEGKAVSQKFSVEEICGEAARAPGEHSHVVDPKPPRLLHGVFPDQVPALIGEAIAQANEKIRESKRGMERGSRRGGPRSIRKDSHSLIAMVSSYPVPWRSDGGGPSLEDPLERALYEQWSRNDLKYVEAACARMGMRLVSTVEHSDEEYPHNHHLAVPENERCDARLSHPGYAAKNAVAASDGETVKDHAKRQNTAFKQAMSRFQDEYHAGVGIDAGLLRVGPKRRRVSRREWMEEKLSAKGIGQANLRKTQIDGNIDASVAELIEAEHLIAANNKQHEHAMARKAETSEMLSALDLAVCTADRDLDASIAKKAELESEISDLSNERQRLSRQVAEVSDQLAAVMANAPRIAEEEVRLSKLKADAAAADQARLESIANNAELSAEHRRLVALADEEQGRKDKLERERNEIGAQIAQGRREHEARALATTAAETALTARQVKDAEHQAEQQQVLKARKRSLEAGEAALDAVTEGLAAYAERRVTVERGSLSGQHLFKFETPDPALQARLEPVASRLFAILIPLEDSFRKRVRALKGALVSAANAWASGLLLGVKAEKLANGQPTFDIPYDAAGDQLLEAIGPFRRIVATMIQALPDRFAIAKAAAVSRNLAEPEPKTTASDFDVLKAAYDRMNGGRPRG